VFAIGQSQRRRSLALTTGEQRPDLHVADPERML
jgi:hypothetical protein